MRLAHRFQYIRYVHRPCIAALLPESERESWRCKIRNVERKYIHIKIKQHCYIKEKKNKNILSIKKKHGLAF